MARHIALLRGINVGKAKRVAMADLRALMESLGHTEVRTLLNSGNVVFDARSGAAASHAKTLQAALAERCGVEAEVIVKTAAVLAAAIAEHPLRARADDDARLLVMFTQDDAALAKLQPLQARDWSPDALAVTAHAAWLWCPTGIADNPLGKAVGKALGPVGTARNWATVLKLDAMAKA
jgi:uncharacterized protein (DUF1697 family)